MKYKNWLAAIAIYSAMMSCRLQDFSATPYNQQFHKWCQEMPDAKISESNGYRQMPALHFVRDAAYAFAHALSNVHRTLCGGKPGMCDQMSRMDGAMLKEAMEKVHFKGEYNVYYFPRFLNRTATN